MHRPVAGVGPGEFNGWMTRCCIIPPHIITALSRSGGEHLIAAAGQTKDLDAGLWERWERRRSAAGRRSAAKGVAPERELAPDRTIHDAQGGRELPGPLVRSEGEPAGDDVAVTEAYEGLGQTWQLWWSAFGRNSLDGEGLPLVASVHYGRDYDNAFWDGEQMVFGDGDGEIFNRFTSSLDVIGHELAHGVTQYTSQLAYEGQSGALNEHCSDVFGVLVKQRRLGQDAGEADWLIGAELLADGVQGRALRSMKAPGTAYDDPRMGKDPQPATMQDYVETEEDNGGVHLNSGIPNKAFHLAATAIGGPAWESAGQIWFDVITGQIDADCDFAGFARLTSEAAVARFGDGSAEADAVVDAWAQVGLAPDEGGAASPFAGGRRAPGGEGPEVVRLSRSGGVAGMTRSREVRLAQLGESDARRVRDLLADPGLDRWAEEKAHPDAFCYGVSCDRPAVAVQLPEPALPGWARDLLERLLRE